MNAIEEIKMYSDATITLHAPFGSAKRLSISQNHRCEEHGVHFAITYKKGGDFII